MEVSAMELNHSSSKNRSDMLKRVPEVMVTELQDKQINRMIIL